MEYPTSHLYSLHIHTIFKQKKKIQVRSGMFHGMLRKCRKTVSCHAIENTLTKFCREKIAAYDGKVKFNTVKYTTAFVYSD